ncbi:MAG: DUF4388 domain-containing protein [Caldiserica bacterium]|nr:DUF4388 domain-containing protein [Caldisericota bacterium]
MLEGKFGNCQVDEVLQTIVQGKGTGRLNLKGTSIFGGRVEATIYIEDSRIVCVEVGAGTAYSSLVDLFSLREGSFSFAGSETAKTQDQSVPVADIVLQVTAALDEWNSMRRRLGSLDAIYALRADGARKDLTLTREQWQVMASLDGKASMREIARKTGKGSVAVSKALYGFMEAGLAAEVEAPAVPQDVEREQSQRRGFFGLWSRK